MSALVPQMVFKLDTIADYQPPDTRNNLGRYTISPSSIAGATVFSSNPLSSINASTAPSSAPAGLTSDGHLRLCKTTDINNLADIASTLVYKATINPRTGRPFKPRSPTAASYESHMNRTNSSEQGDMMPVASNQLETTAQSMLRGIVSDNQSVAVASYHGNSARNYLYISNPRIFTKTKAVFNANTLECVGLWGQSHQNPKHKN